MAATYKHFDLCIIGAGMFGSAAARHASGNPDVKICLIGPKEPTEEEWKYRSVLSSHYDEGRIVSCSGMDRIYKVLTQKSINGFQKLEKHSDMQLYNPTGNLYLYDCYNSRASMVLTQIKAGDKQLQDISSHNLFSERFPFLKLKENQYAFLNINAGHLSPRKLLEVQKRIARSQGCVIINDIVKNIKDAPGGIFEVITEKQEVVTAKKVLICTGAFTNFIPFFAKKELDITVNKETYILLRISEEEANRLSAMPTMDIYHEGVQEQPNLYGAYILPPIKYPDGKYYVKIGHKGSVVNSELSSLGEIRDWYHSKGEKCIFEIYTKLLQDLIPGLKVEEAIRKTCVTCANPSGFPYIDEILPNVTVAVVGNGGGVAVCEEVGRIAACLSLKGIWDSELPKSKFQAVFKNN